MKKQIITITLGILMLVSVMAIYAGDSMTFQTNMTNLVYIVTDNSSSLEGLNVTFEGGNITISTELNYKPDNFTLIFFNEVTREVEKIIYRGGGGSSKTKYVDNNVTVYVPKYITTNETIEVEVEKIVSETITVETGHKTWHLILAIIFTMILGTLVGWFIGNSFKTGATSNG